MSFKLINEDGKNVLLENGERYTGVYKKTNEQKHTRFEYYYKTGLLDGITKEYNDQGKILQEISYSSGEKDGITKIFFNEVLVKKEFYEKNLLKNIKFFKENDLKEYQKIWFEKHLKNSNLNNTVDSLLQKNTKNRKIFIIFIILLITFILGYYILKDNNRDITTNNTLNIESKTATLPSQEFTKNEATFHSKKLYFSDIKYDVYTIKDIFDVYLPQEITIYLSEESYFVGYLNKDPNIIFYQFLSQGDLTLEERYESSKEEYKLSLDYYILQDNFYLVKYKQDGKIGYEKQIYDQESNSFGTTIIEYPEEYDREILPMIDRILNSMKFNKTRIPLNNKVNDIIGTPSDTEELDLLNTIFSEVMILKNQDYLLNFSKDELRYIRNAFYARRGYIFKKAEYQNYFEQQPWYQGVTTDPNILTPEEKELVKIIKKYEM